MIRRACLLVTISLILLQLGTLLYPVPCSMLPSQRERLVNLENFLVNQFDSEVGLVRESPDDAINRTYWLLSDNLLAYHALKPYHPETADKIYTSLEEYGYFKDSLHEALFGEIITLPLYTPQIEVVDEHEDWTIKIETRTQQKGKVMNDWMEYADLLIYAALSEHTKGNTVMALHYFTKAENMWNGAGLYDKPTSLDGFYTTHKLALLLYASKVLNQTLPFRGELEERMWMFQRADGGIKSHYLGNLTTMREANTETASLVLLAYYYGFDEVNDSLEILNEHLSGPYPVFWSSHAKAQFLEAQKSFTSARENIDARDIEEAKTHIKKAESLLTQAFLIEEGFQRFITIFLVAVIIGVSGLSVVYWWRKRKVRKDVKTL